MNEKLKKLIIDYALNVAIPYSVIISFAYTLYFILTNPDKVFPLSTNVNPIMFIYLTVAMFAARWILHLIHMVKVLKEEPK